MTHGSNTVVPTIQPLDEEKFHAAMMECISRQITRHGRARVAQVMNLSIRQLDNLGNGSFPRPDRLANLRALDRDALDPIHREYGERSVPRDAVCTSDPISAKVAALLARTIDIERPCSDGGEQATLAEVLSLCAHPTEEAELRHIVRTFSGWLEQVDAYRAGQKPKLRPAA